jgi:hypothetical protein
MTDRINDVTKRLRRPEGMVPLPAPPYEHREGSRIALAVASMQKHMTNEGWEIMRGLGEAGYLLCGHGLPHDETNVRTLLNKLDPAVALVQDKREWDVPAGHFRDDHARFHHVDALASRPGTFKLTILKDSHQRPQDQMESAKEMGCHAWVIYYHPKIVHRLAPYVRPEHMIRTYHTIDPATVPEYTTEGRAGCLLSGAVSGAYPLRTMLVRNVKRLPSTTLLPHPGYHRLGSATPRFMKTLSRYKVAICTASMYGYALRKLIEATACGCMVITNLPSDEVLPAIDGNLVRVPSNIHINDMRNTVAHCLSTYDPEKQRHYADEALSRYDYQVETARLAGEIEWLRANYP